jgi:replicative DNA helicase
MTEILPASQDIERLVLGAIMLDGGLMDAMRGTLQPEDFSTETHRRIWGAICRVYDAGATVDRITVYHDLDGRKEAQSVGGISYLTDLDTGLPQMPSLENYVGILKEKASMRGVLILVDAIRNRALAGQETSDDLRTALTAGIANLRAPDAESGPISTREMIDRDGIDALLRPKRTEGIRLPWTGLNDLLCGLHPGQMITVGAATGRGKTSFALQIAAHATKQGKSPVIWTLEMTPRQMFVRMVNQMAFADSDRARQDVLSPQERERRREAAYWLHGHPVWFDSHSRTIPAFCSSIRQARAKSDVGVVIVDYLQLIRFAGRAESRTREVGENSRSLKLSALDLELPFVVLSQFKRVEKAHEYGISDLKESGDVENDSDVILIMNGGEVAGDAATPVKVTVGKQREGPAGNDVSLMFHPPSQSFYSPEV